MSRIYINLEIRRLVVEGAGNICEYCLISEEDTTSCQVDHIISVKHGGASTIERQLLIEVGKYPSIAGKEKMS